MLQWANAFYFAWNLGCGFAQSKGQLMGFRFLSGLGGSAPLAIGGVSTDYSPLHRHVWIQREWIFVDWFLGAA